MADLKLGNPIPPGSVVIKRDATHIAVVAMIAGTELKPGQHVKVRQVNWNYDHAEAVEAGHRDAIGIVDPFLLAPVKRGESFWLCLYPGTITSLRHDWTHPKLPAPEWQRVSEMLPPLKRLAAIPVEQDFAIGNDRDMVLYHNAGKSITIGDVLDARAALEGVR